MRRKAMYVPRKIGARSCNNCCSEKAVSITYSKRVSVALLVQLYNIFPHYLIKDTILEKNIEYELCVSILSTTFVWNIFHSKKNWEMWSKKYIGLHVKYPLFLSDFNKIWIYPTDFRKILKYQISWKSVQWEPSFSMWVDGQAGRAELIVALRNFANAPKHTGVMKTRIFLILRIWFTESKRNNLGDRHHWPRLHSHLKVLTITTILTLFLPVIVLRVLHITLNLIFSAHLLFYDILSWNLYNRPTLIQWYKTVYMIAVSFVLC